MIDINDLYKLSSHGICGFVNKTTGRRYMVYSTNMCTWFLNNCRDLVNGCHKNKLLQAEKDDLTLEIFYIPNSINPLLGRTYAYYLSLESDVLMYNVLQKYEFKFDFIIKRGSVILVLKNKRYKKLYIDQFQDMIDGKAFLDSINYDVLKALNHTLDNGTMKWI